MTDSQASGQGSVAFDRAASFYDSTRGFPPGEERNIAALLVRAGGLSAATRVIEVGVGTGRIALPLAASVRAIYGVDLSRPMMERLRAKQQGEPIYLVEADATRLPYASQRFDAAVVVHVFHLIPGWREVLAEIGRVLRPGGLLLHGGDGGKRHLEVLWQAWQSIARRYESVGMGYDDHHESILSAGWEQVGETYSHTYYSTRTPQQYLDELVGRSWSSTWRMTDEDHAASVAAVQEALRVNFPDPNQPMQLERSFEVRVYRRR